MENRYTETDIRGMLQYIPADPASCTVNEWEQIGGALKNELGEAGFSLWDEWASTDPTRYKAKEMPKRWNALKGESAQGKTTIGSIIQKARAHGWNGPTRLYSGYAAKEPITFECIIDAEGYNTKPSSVAGKIRNKLESQAPQAVTLRQFADLVTSGHSFMPAPFRTESMQTANGEPLKTYYTTKQQLFIVDIDNDEPALDAAGKPIKDDSGKVVKHSIKSPVSIERAVEVCREHRLPLVMVYRTFSSKYHRDDQQDPYDKYRLCFLVDRPIEEKQAGQETIQAVRRYFADFFPGAADDTINDNARIIFGTDEKAQLFTDNVGQAADIKRRAILHKLDPETVQADDIRPVASYSADFRAHIEAHKSNIRTGYKQLDIALGGGFNNELYVLGADTGTGKSAIACTLAQNMAGQGVDVLYYALEMSRDEFIARGASMISAEGMAKGRKAIKYGEILNEQYNASIDQFTKIPYSSYSEYIEEYYRRYGKHLYFIEGGTQKRTAQEIAQTVKQFKEERGSKRLAVFIDYLQLLDADESDRTQRDIMTVVSKACKTLKALASQYGATVFVISSMANDKKSKDVNDASFKYSGDIGYTGGVLLGWNWQGATNTADDTQRKNTELAANENGYRDMQLSIIKYRNGEKNTSIALKYYPAYNYIVTDNRADTRTYSNEDTSQY